MSLKSDEKKRIKQENRAQHGHSSSWQLFLSQCKDSTCTNVKHETFGLILQCPNDGQEGAREMVCTGSRHVCKQCQPETETPPMGEPERSSPV